MLFKDCLIDHVKKILVIKGLSLYTIFKVQVVKLVHFDALFSVY